MKKCLISAVLFALPVVAPQFSLVMAASPGAIFTTVVDGTIVNANTQYTSKCDVYLDGGPGPNAPAKAAGLPAGDYYFQVTDPSGQTLLSTDPVSNRRFQVSGGVITEYTGMGGPVHPIGTDQDHPELGAITISLANTTCPADYLDTPNNGGVYKVWVTPVANFIGEPANVDNPCGHGCFHGFASSMSKTDNFKVRPNIPTFCLTVTKQIVTQDGIRPGFNWPIAVTDQAGVINRYYTSSPSDDQDVPASTLSVCGLVAGSYMVEESQEGYQIYGLIVNGVSLPPQTLYSFTWAVGQQWPSVVFQNQSVSN